MSTVFLQVGQCGNQVGQAVLKRIGKDDDVVNSHSFIANDGKFRSVAVDSEPKVLKKLVKTLPFRESSVVTGKRGRGTNWALGYHGLKSKGDDTLLEDTLEAVRGEIERCDRFHGVVLLHSLSGGTGSGLGSRLAEVLREEFTMNYLMSCVVAPHASGESPLQHYNSLLTLAALQREEFTMNYLMSCVVAPHASGEAPVQHYNSLLTLAALQSEEFTMNYLMLCVVAPHASGESPLQHYNSLLTLAAQQRSTDCIVLTHNDDVLYRVQKRKGEERVSFNDLNTAIATQLCGLFLPTDSLRTKTSYSVGTEPWEMVRSICPMPSLKFVNIAQHTRSQQTWEGIFGQLSVTLKKYDRNGQPFSSLGNVVVARGDTTGGFHLHTQTLEAKIRQAYNCVPWNPFPVDFWSARLNSCGSKNSASLTVAANSSSVVEYLGTVLERSKVMYDSNAYLHWYWRHGASKEQFEEAFEEVHSIVDSYKEAVR